MSKTSSQMLAIYKCFCRGGWMTFHFSRGTGGWLFSFRLFKSIFFKLNFIVLFPFLLKYYHMFNFIVFLLGCVRPSGLLFFMPASLLTFFVCFHARNKHLLFHPKHLLFPCASVWENTRAWVLPISYSHTAPSFSARRKSPCFGRNFVYQNLIKLCINVSVLLLTFNRNIECTFQKLEDNS